MSSQAHRALNGTELLGCQSGTSPHLHGKEEEPGRPKEIPNTDEVSDQGGGREDGTPEVACK